ncbi:hypothetical protein AO380_0887 [Moraxella catarrhalis]|nr:hypothetical protein AO380_0887 [Moraxella catarrhalis]
MKILIDADALPVIAKELIIKTANRTQTMAVFVANRMTKLPPSIISKQGIWSLQATFRLPMMC